MSNACNQRTCHRTGCCRVSHRPYPRKINYLRPRADIKAILPGPHVHLISSSCENQRRQEETETSRGHGRWYDEGETKAKYPGNERRTSRCMAGMVVRSQPRRGLRSLPTKGEVIIRRRPFICYAADATMLRFCDIRPSLSLSLFVSVIAVVRATRVRIIHAAAEITHRPLIRNFNRELPTARCKKRVAQASAPLWSAVSSFERFIKFWNFDHASTRRLYAVRGYFEDLFIL